MAIPRRVKAKITRTVTEIAIVLLDSDGNVDEVEDICEELDASDIDVVAIHTIISII